MSTPQAELLKRYYAAWSRQDPDAVMAFFSDSSVFEDLAFAAKFEGLSQIRSFVDLTYVGVPDFRVVPQNIIAEGARVAAEWIMSGTHLGDLPSGLAATGKHFDVRAVSIVQLEGDKIATITDYWNPLEFRRAVGLLDA